MRELQGQSDTKAREITEEIPLSVIQEGGVAFVSLMSPSGLKWAKLIISMQRLEPPACLCLVYSQRAKSKFLPCPY